MAQLRDAQTSELIAEGPPEDIAQIAAGMDPADILFDDVGIAFDPAVVLRAGDEQIAGLDRAIADSAVNDKTALRAAVQRRRDQIEAAKAARPAARAAMKTARDRVRSRSGR